MGAHIIEIGIDISMVSSKWAYYTHSAQVINNLELIIALKL